MVFGVVFTDAALNQKLVRYIRSLLYSYMYAASNIHDRTNNSVCSLTLLSTDDRYEFFFNENSKIQIAFERSTEIHTEKRMKWIIEYVHSVSWTIPAKQNEEPERDAPKQNQNSFTFYQWPNSTAQNRRAELNNLFPDCLLQRDFICFFFRCFRWSFIFVYCFLLFFYFYSFKLWKFYGRTLTGLWRRRQESIRRYNWTLYGKTERLREHTHQTIAQRWRQRAEWSLKSYKKQRSTASLNYYVCAAVLAVCVCVCVECSAYEVSVHVPYTYHMRQMRSVRVKATTTANTHTIRQRNKQQQKNKCIETAIGIESAFIVACGFCGWLLLWLLLFPSVLSTLFVRSSLMLHVRWGSQNSLSVVTRFSSILSLSNMGFGRFTSYGFADWSFSWVFWKWRRHHMILGY